MNILPLWGKLILRFRTLMITNPERQATTAGWASSCQSINPLYPVLTVICPRLVSSPILLYKIDLVCGDTNQKQSTLTKPFSQK